MERTVKCSTTMLCLTLLYIVSINSQPLESTSKLSSKVNNQKKEALNNSSTQTGASTHPYLFHNTGTTKVEATTHGVEVSTFPPLVREPFPPLIKDPQHIIHFSTEMDTSASQPVNDTELPISIEDRVNLLETISYPPPTRNPNLGINLHQSDKITTSTHPPLVLEMKPSTPIKRDDLQVLPLSAPTNVVSSEPAENLRVSTSSIPKHRISENTPLIAGEQTLEATQNQNFIVSTHPSLLSEMESINRTEAVTITSSPTRSTVANAVTLQVTTIPPPTRNPNLGISLHPHEVISPKPVEASIISAENTPYLLSTQNSNFTVSTHPPLLSEMESTKKTEALTITSPPTKSTEANAISLETTTYPSPTRNPNLGISIHRPEKTNASTPATALPKVNSTLNTDSDIPSKNITIADKLNNKKCPFAIVGCCPRVMAPNDSCFQLLGCPGPFWDKNPCDKDIIDRAIKIVEAYYSKGE